MSTQPLATIVPVGVLDGVFVIGGVMVGVTVRVSVGVRVAVAVLVGVLVGQPGHGVGVMVGVSVGPQPWTVKAIRRLLPMEVLHWYSVKADAPSCTPVVALLLTSTVPMITSKALVVSYRRISK